MSHDASDAKPGHSPYLAHHFESEEQQFTSAKLGMWVFLVTEVLLFGGLFAAYAFYRANHPEIFIYAHQFLDKILGGINTIVLICSSLTMAWAVRAAQLGKRKQLVVLLAATLVFAAGFLGIKYVEYKHKWEEGLLWGKRYSFKEEAHGGTAAPAQAPSGTVRSPLPPPPTPAPGEERSVIPPPGKAPGGLAPRAMERVDNARTGARVTHPERHEIVGKPENVQIFFGIYFSMTGLHGLHVLGGMGAIFWILWRARRGEFGPNYFIPVDLVGLYWHLVDLIWIFLFPLLYLIH